MKTLLLVLCATAYGQTAPTLLISASPVRPGGTASLAITLSGSANIAALQWSMPTLPAGATVTAGFATIAASKSVVCQSNTAPSASGMTCIVYGGSTVLTDGVLATVTFPVPALVPQTTGSAVLTINLSGALGVNAAGDSPGIPITAASSYLVPVLSPCDINGDGKTDLLDVRNLIDQIEGVMAQTSDLTGDGATSILDLQRVVNAVVNGTCRTGV